MTAKRFICMIAISSFLCVGLGIYGFMIAGTHPDDYKSAEKIQWVLPPSTSYHIERWGEVFFVNKGETVCVMTVKDGKPQWRASGVLEYGGANKIIYCEDGKYGYMDLDGKILIKARFDYAEAFCGDYALVKNADRESIVINQRGNELFAFGEEKNVLWAEEGLLSISNQGDRAPARIFDCKNGAYTDNYQNKRPLGKNLYSVTVDSTKDEDSISVIRDEDGYLLLGGERFLSIDEFDHGISFVKTESGESGYMNTNGEMVLTLADGWEAGSFREGKGIVDMGKKILIVNENGRIITERPKRNIIGVRFCFFSEGFSQVCVKNEGETPPESWGYMDENGEFVVPPIFSHVEPVSQGCAVVYYGSSMGIVKVK